MSKNIDILIIGAGPAGLSVAAEARYHELGSTLVLEKGPDHNQTVRVYYPDDKRVDADYKGQDAICAGLMCFRETTKPLFLSAMDHLIQLHEVKIETGAGVDSIKKNDDGTFTVSGGEESWIARWVVVAIGRMGKPNQPPYFKQIPASVKKHVHFEVNKVGDESKKVLVVGGGNTAVEYALSLVKKVEVALSYRKAVFSRINDMNQGLLKKDEEEGKIRVLRESNVVAVEDEGGKPRAVFENGDREVFDDIIYGIGGSKPSAFLTSAGIELNDKGTALLDEWLESSVEGLYVAGELARPMGQGSIINSFNSGKTIVEGIMKKHGLGRRPEVVDIPMKGA